KEALELYVVVETLTKEGKFDEAAVGFETLDKLRQYLPADRKVDYDGLRREFQKVTGQLRPLSQDEKVARAEEHFEAGLDAYRQKDYVSARRHLNVASAFDVSLGWWDNRKLRKVSGEVNATLERLLADYARGQQLLEAGSYADARQMLLAVKGSGIDIGQAEEVEKLLAEAEQKMAEQAQLEEAEQEEQARREREELAKQEQREQEELERRQQAEREQLQAQAAALLAHAGALVGDQRYDEAGDALAELAGLAGRLDADQQKEYGGLCAAVEEATGVPPGATAKQRVAKAEEYFELGLEAYKQRDYAQAQMLLDRAARLGVNLGRWDNRKLRNVRGEVNATLGRLLAEYARAQQLFEAGDYADARDVVRGVRDSGIGIGQDEAIEELLAAIEQKIDEQARREREALSQRVAKALAEAGALSGAGQHEEAIARLAELDEVATHLSPEQQVESARLRAASQEAAKAAEVQRDLERAGQLARQADEILATLSAVSAKVRAADQALAQDDLDAAKPMLVEAKELLKGSDVSASPALGELSREVDEKLAALERGIARRAHLEAVRQRLSAMILEAEGLMPRDLLEAERTMLEAEDLAEQEGLALADDQARVRDAVRDAVEARYGTERRLRPEQYGGLVELSERYGKAAEYEKQAQLLTLVKDAPAGLVAGDYRNHAVGKLTAAAANAAQQAQQAQRTSGLFARCRGELKQGDLQALQAALADARAAVQMAEEQGLAGACMRGVLQKAVSFLETDFQEALAATYPDLKEIVDERLDLSRTVLAVKLSDLYLNEGSPDLAEPYLRRVAASGGREAAQWAKAQSAAVEELKANAEQARLLALEPDARRVVELAERLHQLATAGGLDQAAAVEQELADARLQLQVKKAENALNRGAYVEAARLLEGAPVEKASRDLVAQAHQPLEARLTELREVAVELMAAEDALAAYDIAAARSHLAAAHASGVESAPLKYKMASLRVVVDAVLDISAEEAALTAERDRDLADARRKLAAVRVRKEAWSRYFGALKAFLEASEGGRAGLQQVVAEPEGLRDFELSNARYIVATLAEAEGEPALADAAAKLSEAKAEYAVGNYLAAGALLRELRAMPGFVVSEDCQRQAGELAGQIQAKERKAEELYSQAIDAYKAGDAEAVGRITSELSKYRNTKAYRSHR
ncbi:MAG: coiled-coil domain-containing protein, partial [Planctomycetota bacterium]